MKIQYQMLLANDIWEPSQCWKIYLIEIFLGEWLVQLHLENTNKLTVPKAV